MTSITHRSIYNLLIISVFLVLSVQSVKAETINCTAITSTPHVITTQGVYCLTGNLVTSITSGNAIEIQTNNVTIDLNGFKIGGLAAGPSTWATGIYAFQRKNITIRNGSIRGFMQGINLLDDHPYTTSSGHLVEDIRADGNTFRGILTLGTGNLIRNNQVINTGGSTVQNSAFGIYMSGPNNIVRGNIVNTTTGTTGVASGVVLSQSDASLVKDNLVTNTTGSGTTYGIFLSGSSPVSVRENDVTTADHGIFYSSSTGKYMDNLTNDVTTPFTGGTAVGTNN